MPRETMVRMDHHYRPYLDKPRRTYDKCLLRMAMVLPHLILGLRRILALTKTANT